MYVDGASHRPWVDEAQPARRPHDATHSDFAGEAPQRDGLYLPDMSHPAHILRDTFVRLQEKADRQGGYPAQEHGIRRPVPVASVFQELRDALGTGYHAEIADLQTVVESRGLPLTAGSHAEGVVYHAFLAAYDRARLDQQGSADTDHHDVLDTSG